jgi:carbamoyltransferase
MITLGLNYSQMHDSSACLVRDGELLFAVAEERISRLKHDARFPALAIRACLDFAKLSPEQVDEVCVGWQAPGATYRHDLKLFATGNWPVNYLNVLNSTRHFLSMWHQNGGANLFAREFSPKARFRFVDHHLAHALSAYSYSGFDDSAIIVMDGRGAWKATSIWRGSKGRVEHVQTIDWPNSLGLFYARFTEFLGFTPNADEWKVMGLAPYGQPGVDLSAFLEPADFPYKVHVDRLMGDGGISFSGWPASLGSPREPESDISELHKNIAYAVQEMCEVAMMSVVRAAIAKAGSKNLCLAGGVALNSKANGKIAASGLVDNIFVQPAAADDGVALGAALAPFLDGGQRLPLKAMRHAYLGPCFDDSAIETALKTYKIRASHLSDPAATAAELLSHGKILGWFQGRMEFGPRALGNRSLLADPRRPEMRDILNQKVKHREDFRPFAPSVMAEHADEWFEVGTPTTSHEFMLFAPPVRHEQRKRIPAIVHQDGTARVQLVSRKSNPRFHELISRFHEKTGVPVVINTSFNDSEPIVCTPMDAIVTFRKSGIDALFMDNVVLTAKG